MTAEAEETQEFSGFCPRCKRPLDDHLLKDPLGAICIPPSNGLPPPMGPSGIKHS